MARVRYIILTWLFVQVISNFLTSAFSLEFAKSKQFFLTVGQNNFPNKTPFSSHLPFFSVFRSGSGSRWSHHLRRRSHPGFANYCQAWNYFDAWTNFTHEFFPPNCYVSNEESNQWNKNLWCCAFQVRRLDYRQFHT